LDKIHSHVKRNRHAQRREKRTPENGQGKETGQAREEKQPEKGLIEKPAARAGFPFPKKTKTNIKPMTRNTAIKGNFV
jgi:hypothetical protein